MLTTILSAVFVSAVIGTKPTLKAIKRINEAVETAKKEKAAKEEAMEIYLHREIMDIEH